MQETVIEKINAIVREGGEKSEASTKDIFKYRTAAAKEVFLSLSPDEQAIMLKKIEDGGYSVPVDVQQR